MDHSRKLKSINFLRNIRDVMFRHIKPGDHLTVALSGGVDSVVLLHILVTLSREMPLTLSAVHVNHGISSNATLWSKFCCHLCHAYGVSIYIAYLKIKKEKGESLEARAREERYRVFNQIQANYVVLAQHLDDQAETLLLQLFRGAGIKGLCGMPLVRKQSSIAAPQILRPLLEISRDEIEAYGRLNKLNWINDESNNNTIFNRNFLRHDVFPILKKRYPNYPKTLLRTSRHFSEASLLLDELAVIDNEHCVVLGNIQINHIRLLSFARAKNLLRYKLLQQGITPPSTAKLETILHQILSAGPDSQPCISFGNTEIRSYKGSIYILPSKTSLQCSEHYVWNGEAHLLLSHLNGTIRFTEAKSQGISQKKISAELITIRSRKGGEFFMPACNRPRRSLKNLLQEASIPPWKRSTIPLMFYGEKLIWVPSIGIDCEFQAKSDELGILPIWNPM
ncbi:MAG: tRNA lysidine(34) synthetase TilS [Nitrosomonas sp.]|uniref:tRNA lysidine(34) synthetase TilS n=1 Tax=Nitrosomonas sp. TaxID=42353 RepID=UPI0025DD3C7E|nr:tRNA lysidine(34) synthetase TilS [Nitrosomonas sp.]MBY0474926.1 tRNA lysidine(34) synthetase TilS [Nitrosomonas sp.]